LSSFWPKSLARRRPGRRTPTATGEGLGELIARLPEAARLAALTHSSWADDRIASYERLAMLGDRVLGLAVASELYLSYPELDAGQLTKIFNQAVSGTSCAEVGRQLGIPAMLVEAEPEGNDGSRTSAKLLLEGERPLPEMTEAMIGSCFLEFGYEVTAAAVAQTFRPQVERVQGTMTDFKSALQEALAGRGQHAVYEVVATVGPPHQRTYEVVVSLDGREIGRGSGRSKKAAGQQAARQGLEWIAD
jgi:ribonuclease-3